MEDQERFEKLWNDSPMGKMGCGTPIAFAILIGVLFFLASCVTKTVVEYRDRNVNHYTTKYVHDTLRIKESDSVHHSVTQKGDTIFEKLYVEKTRYRDKVVEKHDTCWRDSIQTCEVKKTVKEKVVPTWCYYTLIGYVVFLVYIIVKVSRHGKY